jgi:hypothetical protein
MKRFFPELSDEERAEFNEQVRQDIKNPQYHLYCDMYNLSGRELIQGVV